MALTTSDFQAMTARRKDAVPHGASLSDSVLREVVTVKVGLGQLRKIYRGSVGSLIALGVLTPPEA